MPLNDWLLQCVCSVLALNGYTSAASMAATPKLGWLIDVITVLHLLIVQRTKIKIKSFSLRKENLDKYSLPILIVAL